MPTTREHLEAALRASWSRADLEVYADELQTAGDPRGELIALDLAVPANRFDDLAVVWRERRHALIASWVGSSLAAEVGARLRCGFLEDVGESADVLASPAGEFVRDFHAAGDAALRALASRPRPWLTRLRLTAPIDDAVIAAVIAAAPNLEELDVEGDQVVQRFDHPRLMRLRITGAAAIGEAASFPAVTHLDLRYEHRAIPYATRARFPALTQLDLSRNVRGDQPPTWFADLGDLPIADRITHLRLPALCTDREASELAASLDRLPAVLAVEVARHHGRAAGPIGAELAHRRPPVIIPVAFPWPDPATITDGVTLVVGIPEEPYDDIIAVAPLIELLEREFERFSSEARAAWTELWTALDREVIADDEAELHDAEIQQLLPIATLLRAVAACDALESRSWIDFRVHLRHASRTLAPDARASLYLYRST